MAETEEPVPAANGITLEEAYDVVDAAIEKSEEIAATASSAFRAAPCRKTSNRPKPARRHSTETGKTADR